MKYQSRAVNVQHSEGQSGMLGQPTLSQSTLGRSTLGRSTLSRFTLGLSTLDRFTLTLGWSTLTHGRSDTRSVHTWSQYRDGVTGHMSRWVMGGSDSF
jgi:hypothetical protein